MFEDLECFLLILFFTFLGFLFSIFFLFSEFIYIDLNDNYGVSNSCFKEFDEKFCELDDGSLIEVKDYKKR